jgi:hypothetical protein
MAGSARFVTFQVQRQDKQCFNVCVNMPEAEGLNCLFSSDNFPPSLSLSLSLSRSLHACFSLFIPRKSSCARNADSKMDFLRRTKQATVPEVKLWNFKDVTEVKCILSLLTVSCCNVLSVQLEGYVNCVNCGFPHYLQSTR